MITFIVRLCGTWVLEIYGFNAKICDHIEEFFQIYVEPAWEVSTMFRHRIQIRGNQYLNKLLHDNGEGLRSIFERYKSEETH